MKRERTDEIGDLPLDDRPTDKHTLEAGRFGSNTEVSR